MWILTIKTNVIESSSTGLYTNKEQAKGCFRKILDSEKEILKQHVKNQNRDFKCESLGNFENITDWYNSAIEKEKFNYMLKGFEAEIILREIKLKKGFIIY